MKCYLWYIKKEINEKSFIISYLLIYISVNIINKLICNIFKSEFKF